jgi:hypothetical protein
VINTFGGSAHSASKGRTSYRVQVFPVDEDSGSGHGPVRILMRDGKRLRRPEVIPVEESNCTEGSNFNDKGIPGSNRVRSSLNSRIC